METISGDGSKTGLVMQKKGKHKSTTSIGASLTPDYREREESNNNYSLYLFVYHTKTKVFFVQ